MKFNVSEAEERDLPHSDVCYFAKSFYEAGADLLVPSGGHVMVNGLHMLRGGRPLKAMAESQTNIIKRAVIALFGKYFVMEETYREAFFREHIVSMIMNCGIPPSKVCLIGGVQDISSADAAISVDHFGFVQLGRVLLADPDWCIKNNIHKRKNNDACLSELQVCDKSNDCIVGATMALVPLRCQKYKSNDW